MLNITPIPAFSDNYIWILVNEKNSETIVIDPGNADPVLTYLQSNRLNLNSILLTHHHWDHTDGVNALLKHYPASSVFASHASSIASVTNPLKEGDIISLDKIGITFKVNEIPGHTLDHLSFFAESNTSKLNNPILFTGDTLFMAGCGKVFEGTTDQMWASLQKIKDHPSNTEIYCGHEYTVNNLKFALAVEPNNQDIQNRLSQVHMLRSKNLPSVPAALALELKTNPFLRTDIPNIIHAASKYANKELTLGAEVFAVRRNWKNHF